VGFRDSGAEELTYSGAVGLKDTELWDGEIEALRLRESNGTERQRSSGAEKQWNSRTEKEWSSGTERQLSSGTGR
jgi:hypothetical protein